MVDIRLLPTIALWAVVYTRLASLAHAARVGCIIDRPLDRSIPSVEASATPLIELLLRFGAENGLCFGVESVDSGLFDARVTMSLSSMPVRNALSRMLMSAPEYEFSVDSGVIVIRKRDAGKHSWLDYRIPEFVAKRANVQSVSNLLYMTLATSTDPTIRGFAGNYRPGDGTDQVGPLHERNKTVRQLLSAIVVGSRGGMWIAYGLGRTRQSVLHGPFWSIFEYSGQTEENVTILRSLREQIATEYTSAPPH